MQATVAGTKSLNGHAGWSADAGRQALRTCYLTGGPFDANLGSRDEVPEQACWVERNAGRQALRTCYQTVPYVANAEGGHRSLPYVRE